MKKALKILKSLSDPTRLRIVILLMEKDLCVCELFFILKMEQSRISHQLRILRETDLVEDIRDGKWVIYRISEKAREKLCVLLDKVFGEELLQSEKIEQDKKNLKICTRKQIRKLKGESREDAT